jgi:hypothetical protein
MGIFDWFKRRPRKLMPEALWQVELTADALASTDQDGCRKAVPKASLSSVIIETNDSGPWGADVWWLMFDENNQLACAFPQGATGETDAIEYFMKLDGFDNGAMIAAMGSTDNAVFQVWLRAYAQ